MQDRTHTGAGGRPAKRCITLTFRGARGGCMGSRVISEAAWAAAKLKLASTDDFQRVQLVDESAFIDALRAIDIDVSIVEDPQ